MQFKVKRLNDDAIIPCFEYDNDTGFSLYTACDVTIKAHKKYAIPTGLMFECPVGYAFQIKCRSGITLYGCPTTTGDLAKITVYEGTIDNGYRGEVSIIVENNESHKITIPKGTKIAQGVIIKYYQAKFIEVEEIMETDRGQKGFGSTGTK